MKKIKFIVGLPVLAASLLVAACEPITVTNNPITYGDGYCPLSTDKAMYKPGEEVRFNMDRNIDGQDGVMVRYKHLDEVLFEEQFNGAGSWTWTPPAEDKRGYMVDLHKVIDGKDSVFYSIAVDVSSDPKFYPRNGFLSAFEAMPQSDIKSVMSHLNRYHINYVQFQDWHYKHHMPLAGSPSAPMQTWTDICSRTNSKSTVDSYISLAHEYGMVTLFYNLAYGALDDAATDGVADEWYVFTDRNHTTKDVHELGAPFKSSIYLLDPSNPEWQEYLGDRNDDVYEVFAFDGYQIDQLGGRGTRYNYDGGEVKVDETFKGFVEYMKSRRPDKRLVMNAVGQYGQENSISKTDVDFLYTEVWGSREGDTGNPGFTALSDVITQNDSWGGGKETVLAAYMNYDYGKLGNSTFNTPGVLMAMSAIYAWGGSILNMGEHMLCNEYFPNSNLSMTGELKQAVIRYYDFLTAYENPLRDAGDWIGVDAVSAANMVSFNQWPPQLGNIATVGKRMGGVEYVHFLNYSGASHLNWRDSDANQTAPTRYEDLQVQISVNGTVRDVWCATPDADSGVSRKLEFSQKDNQITVTIPVIQYWTMVAIEY